jgi:hypothetical protein
MVRRKEITTKFDKYIRVKSKHEKDNEFYI